MTRKGTGVYRKIKTESASQLFGIQFSYLWQLKKYIYVYEKYAYDVKLNIL